MKKEQEHIKEIDFRERKKLAVSVKKQHIPKPKGYLQGEASYFVLVENPLIIISLNIQTSAIFKITETEITKLCEFDLKLTESSYHKLTAAYNTKTNKLYIYSNYKGLEIVCLNSNLVYQKSDIVNYYELGSLKEEECNLIDGHSLERNLESNSMRNELRPNHSSKSSNSWEEILDYNLAEFSHKYCRLSLSFTSNFDILEILPKNQKLRKIFLNFKE